MSTPQQILTEFQLWRRSQGKYGREEPRADFPYSAAQVGIALDEVMKDAFERLPFLEGRYKVSSQWEEEMKERVDALGRRVEDLEFLNRKLKRENSRMRKAGKDDLAVLVKIGRMAVTTHRMFKDGSKDYEAWRKVSDSTLRLIEKRIAKDGEP